MAVTNFDELIVHRDHKIECTTYGDPTIINASLECITCSEVLIDFDRYNEEVFVTDDGIVPTCDICNGPQMSEGNDWNGETGNHHSCEDYEAAHSFVKGYDEA